MLEHAQRQKKRQARVLWIWSFAMTLFSLPCILSFGYDVLIGASPEGTLLLMSFFGLILAAGIVLGIKARQLTLESRRLVVPEDLERFILQLVRKNDGELSAATLALESKLNLDQSAHVLAEFEKRGHAYSVVVGEASRRYIFPDLKASRLPSDAGATDADDFMRRLAESEQVEEPHYHTHES
ncbi:hypothetical protein EA187_17940 [Lujinxingia sediminis]|uniref:Uncharacterized protein n=1 Tax=Lujinxingia sediminis TaxID=2480984 RepID=A0ABY0CPP1_9DELT|nr:hypothetical protein [Lujinxingia sediminis]RVU41541.1 hypothetical protein EA187_17940 [Lujinxingia sediminis]